MIVRRAALSAMAAFVLGGLALGPVTPAQAQAPELKMHDIKEGTGRRALAPRQVTVHYTGWLMNGQKFDSSHDRGQPFTFKLGSYQVIRGWELGVKGMREGGVRELVIPPEMAYGRRGAGEVIPPNATLKFEVELLKVE